MNPKPTPTRPQAFADGGEAANSAIKFPVTIGRRVSAPTRIAIRDIAWVMDCVKGGNVEGTDIRALIEVIRAQPSDAFAKGMKKTLPWFCGSLCLGRRANDSVSLAHFAILDFDAVPDPAAFKARARAKLPWLRYAFRSPRDGVKLVAQFATPVTREVDFRNLYAYLRAQAESALKFPSDATCDWARACYFSWDPDLLSNPACRPLNVPRALAEWELVESLARAEGRMQRAAAERSAHSADSIPDGTRNPAHRNNAERTKSASAESFARARAIVEKLAQREMEYLDWIKAGMALYVAFGEAGRDIWLLFAANPNYADTLRGLDQKWRSFAATREINLETLFFIGERYGCL